jgi:hypothetical protein
MKKRKKGTVQLDSAYYGARPGPLEPFGPWDRNRGFQSPFPTGASPVDSSRPAATHRRRRCWGARGHDGESDLGHGRVRLSPEEASIGEVHSIKEEDDNGLDC